MGFDVGYAEDCSSADGFAESSQTAAIILSARGTPHVHGRAISSPIQEHLSEWISLAHAARSSSVRSGKRGRRRDGGIGSDTATD